MLGLIHFSLAKAEDFGEEDFEEEERDVGTGEEFRRPEGRNFGDEFGEEDFMDEFGEEVFGDELEEGNTKSNSNSGMDPYSYFNSVPSKGSNFVPILSDFSKFGR